MNTAIENFQVCRQNGLRFESILDTGQKFYVVRETCVELVTFLKVMFCSQKALRKEKMLKKMIFLYLVVSWKI